VDWKDLLSFVFGDEDDGEAASAPKEPPHVTDPDADYHADPSGATWVTNTRPNRFTDLDADYHSDPSGATWPENLHVPRHVAPSTPDDASMAVEPLVRPPPTHRASERPPPPPRPKTRYQTLMRVVPRK
jgi:hypothetical protein